MEPHLVRWDERYRRQGLVIIEVDNGKIDSRDAAMKHVRENGLTYPFLWDRDEATVRAYGVRRYAMAYLIGADGKVLWEGDPTRVVWPDDPGASGPVLDETFLREHEARIEAALESVDLAELRAAGTPFLTRAPEDAGESETAELGGGTASDRVVIGWHFRICTADNDMRIHGVDPESPAEKAGLAAGDRVLSIDDLVLDSAPFDELKAVLHRIADEGDPFTLRVRRDEEVHELTIEPKAAPRAEADGP